ncbi:MBL fold metallo-hydrolase [Janibacter cremeus]|uniref:Glyoxylase-like metal-dependent hydrolase (Beta-lactamase superfamily II) n=1 Tax=Janibacter cremeus TaxID=1285192 RepID=A0A852VQF9_9MICO|nr:MBL fold metallo-hydrolase [Janibacter cremeus]NYF96943.1 glyoxylase-like metal-dependent hydrolase (beta-lactamase superfamily II) [Janibacter cremeus]
MDWTTPGPEEVAPGVHRIPLPLPMDGLKAVNVYAVLGEESHTLIDGGWEIDIAQRALQDALGELGLAPQDFDQCLVTHHHRDHYTMALGLRRRAGLVVGLGEGEAEQLEAIRSTTGGFNGARDLLLAADATSVIEGLAALPSQRLDPQDWEDPDRWLQDEESVAAAGRSLRVRATPGHTQGHVVFFDDESDLIFAGDHVLPHITPSIGFQTKPVRTPLADYLGSLADMLTERDRLLLPAHGLAGGRLHARVEELLAHHDTRLAQTEAAVRAGASTGFAVTQALRWTRHERHLSELDAMNQMLATTETLAHLQVLVAQERVRESTVDGCWRYS